jgi:phosphotransferase family enzyme
MALVDTQDDVEVQVAEAWVASSVPIVGHLELVQTEPWASVFRVPLAAGTVWFKACAPHSSFEVPLTASLSARWSTTVTEVLAYNLDRRWLLMADAGQPLSELGNPPERWLDMLPAYAQLQIGEMDHADGHLGVGVPDLRLGLLPGRYDELIAAVLPLLPSESAALAAFAQRFSSLCEELESHGMGATVQHDDLHMNNVYVKDGALRVLDWGDASISHPFFSLFETFRFLNEMNELSPGDPWFGRLRDAYLEPWGAEHVETFDLALRVAGFAHAIAWLDQRNALPARDRPDFDTGFATILRVALRIASDTLSS